MNTKITLEFSTGEHGVHEVNDEIETLILKGKPLTIKTVHPNVGEVMIIEAGNTREHRAKQLLVELRKVCKAQHSLIDDNLEWSEIYTDLNDRIEEVLK